MNPIYVPCHLCHAQVGELCKFALDEGQDFHDRRVKRANVLMKDTPPIDTRHGLAHGDLCVDHPAGVCEGICTVCGQRIARLQNIPQIIREQLESLLR
jgi:hypothetical protein